MKRPNLNLDLTSVIVIVAVGVLLPVLLATAAAIVALFFAREAGGIITVGLVISFAVTAMGSGLITVVLTGKKMRLARRQADFIAGMSHELRTPLSAIRLYTQTLQSGHVADDPAKTAECLQTILRETEWLDVMLDRVLTWRAASRDMLPLTMKSQPVNHAVQDAVARFRSMVPRDEVTLRCSGESTRQVQHDSRALNTVVLNLLTNAYKYTGADKLIDVRVFDERTAVLIDVHDNGVGMTPAQLKHVFKAFYRVETDDGVKSSGAGLGLAIARHLIERQSATIEASSEQGVGSTFTIRFPVADGGAEHE